MIFNVFKVLIPAYYLKNSYNFFNLRLLFFYPWPLFAILKMLLSFLNLVQYIFTCIFQFCFHACYICDCNTLGGNLIRYLGCHVICWCWSTVFSEIPVLYASFYRKALWRFWFHFPAGIGTAHTAKGTKSWFNGHGVTVLDLASKLAWPEPHR